MTNSKFVSCVMPTTAKRVWCIPWAIEYWLSQHYYESELLIVTDGPDVEVIEGIVLGLNNPRVRHVHFRDPIPLGHKYNLCAELAKYDWIALWADDDWHAPFRLSYTMTALDANPGKEIAGLRKMLFHMMGTDRTYLYQYPNSVDPYFLGGSLIFNRSYWERHRFDGGAERRADASFTNGISLEEYHRVAVVLDNHRFYVAMNHDDNTGRNGNADPSGDRWVRMPRSELRELMGDVSARYTARHGPTL